MLGKTENINMIIKLENNVLKKLRLLSSFFFLKFFFLISVLLTYN